MSEYNMTLFYDHNGMICKYRTRSCMLSEGNKITKASHLETGAASISYQELAIDYPDYVISITYSR